VGREVKEKIVGKHGRAPEEDIPNGCITGRFGALLSCPVRVGVLLNGVPKFELRRGWYLGEGC